MKPNQIRAEMILNDVSATKIANDLGISRPAVSRTIHGVMSTPRIQQAIALAIGRTVGEVFPDKKSPTPEQTSGVDAGRHTSSLSGDGRL